MKYIYYPGCSLEATALEYNTSTRAVMKAMGAELIDLEDWTCCGASAAEARSHLLSMVLAARNLALAEKMNAGKEIMIPCSACYLNLRRVEDHVDNDIGLLAKINKVLEEENLQYKKGIKVRHLMDVLARDFRPEKIENSVKKKLSGLKVAPYYGCQSLRPFCDFDDPEQPVTMEPIIKALGADVHSWNMGAKCCGAALMTTKKDAAKELTASILREAEGADCIVTICPMCQMNLDAYQGEISRSQGEDLRITVLYLPQLMGLAFDLPEEGLNLNKNLAITKGFQNKTEALKIATV